MGGLCLIFFLQLFLPSPAKPFVEICMKQHNKYEAKKYAARVGPEQKVKALLLVGCVTREPCGW